MGSLNLLLEEAFLGGRLHMFYLPSYLFICGCNLLSTSLIGSYSVRATACYSFVGLVAMAVEVTDNFILRFKMNLLFHHERKLTYTKKLIKLAAHWTFFKCPPPKMNNVASPSKKSYFHIFTIPKYFPIFVEIFNIKENVSKRQIP